MGMMPITAAFEVTVGDANAKALLVALADHACEHCGLAWPGVKLLREKTEQGEKRVQAGVKLLLDAGLLAVFRFPHGGRGLSTEYVVLPHLWEGATRPCIRCRSVMKSLDGIQVVSVGKTPHTGAGVLIDETPHTGAGVLTETPSIWSRNPAPGGSTNPHRTINPHARARARRDESGLPAGREAHFDAAPAQREIPPEIRAHMVAAGVLPPRATAKAPQDGTGETESQSRSSEAPLAAQDPR